MASTTLLQAFQFDGYLTFHKSQRHIVPGGLLRTAQVHFFSTRLEEQGFLFWEQEAHRGDGQQKLMGNGQVQVRLKFRKAKGDGL